MTQTSPDIANDQAAAFALEKALNDMAVRAYVHWDRSPWGVRIPLTDDYSEDAPALYVLTENEPAVERLGGRKWFGQMRLPEGPIDDAGMETGFTWLERSWVGENTDTVAERVEVLVQLLRAGASVLLPPVRG